jgi:uncharacterized protein (TIGR03083 family)
VTGSFGFEPTLAAIAAESRRLSDAVAAADLDVTVPSTPEWTVRDLAHHIGRGQWFWGANVAAGNAEAMAGVGSTPVPEDADLLAWLGWCTYSLLHALREAGPDAPAWSWWPAPRTSGAVARHQAQEVSVHRWDAELAARGGPSETVTALPAEVATDGVPEFIEMMVGDRVAALTGEVTLTATDTDSSWRVDAAGVRGRGDGGAGGDGDTGAGSGSGPGSGSGSGSGSGGRVRRAELRASASDLVLMLYRRLPVPDSDVEGDPVLVASLLSLGQTK